MKNKQTKLLVLLLMLFSFALTTSSCNRNPKEPAAQNKRIDWKFGSMPGPGCQYLQAYANNNQLKVTRLLFVLDGAGQAVEIGREQMTTSINGAYPFSFPISGDYGVEFLVEYTGPYLACCNTDCGSGGGKPIWSRKCALFPVQNFQDISTHEVLLSQPPYCVCSGC